MDVLVAIASSGWAPSTPSELSAFKIPLRHAEETAQSCSVLLRIHASRETGGDSPCAAIGQFTYTLQRPKEVPRCPTSKSTRIWLSVAAEPANLSRGP